jgi:hypothetical protein
VLGQKHTLKVGKFQGHPINYTYHLTLPIGLAKKLLQQKIKRVQLIIGSHTLHKPIQQYKGVYFFTFAQKERKLFNVGLGDSLEVIIDEDKSQYQIKIPEEMKVLLEEDKEGSKHFHNLTPGKQRSLLYIVDKVKSSELRLNKALAIVEHLKTNSGKLDFKVLYEAFKLI